LLETRFAEERRRLQFQEDHNTRNFSEFLDSIDEIKANLLAYYVDMPKCLAVMIHHHAAELLKEAWHSPSARERLKRQTRFTDLMLAITEDLAALGREGKGQALPERTLACIRKTASSSPSGERERRFSA
jgi:acyl-CoA reductase-like NAD-dependent aldehyde dehydrogenase